VKDVLTELSRHRLTYRIGLRLTEAERNKVAEIAERHGVTLTAAARALIRLGIEADRMARDAAESKTP